MDEVHLSMISGADRVDDDVIVAISVDIPPASEHPACSVGTVLTVQQPPRSLLEAEGIVVVVAAGALVDVRIRVRITVGVGVCIAVGVGVAVRVRIHIRVHIPLWRNCVVHLGIAAPRHQRQRQDQQYCGRRARRLHGSPHVARGLTKRASSRIRVYTVFGHKQK